MSRLLHSIIKLTAGRLSYSARRWVTSLFLATTVCSPLSSWAAVYPVTSTSDGGDGVCDSSCTLRDAIRAANLNPGTDTLSLSAGIYTLSVSGVDENAAAGGDLDIVDDIIISGDSRTTTIIDAGDIDRIFHVVVPTAVSSVTAAISNLTIRNGSVASANGGGMAIAEGGNVTLTNVNIEDNVTTNPSTVSELGIGGGIYNDGILTMSNCTVSGNIANVSQSGRAIAGGGGLYNDQNGDATLQSVVFAANSVTNDFGDFSTGGGILNRGDLLIENNSTIGGADASAGNEAHSGGGIANIGGVMFVYNTTISYNTTTIEPDSAAETGGQGGGGIFAQNSGTDRGSVFIDSTTISYNYADRQGGGIFNSGAPLTLSHSTVDNNRARYNGAGMANVSSVPAEITNSTFYANRGADNNGTDVADSNGGGVYTSSRINISSSTLYNNDAALGAQVYAARTTGSTAPQISFKSSIIAHGSNNADGNNNCIKDPLLAGDDNFIQSSDYNIDTGPAGTGDEDTTVITSYCFLNAAATGAGFSDLTDRDPSTIFGSNILANNGGPTRTLALAAGSIAIDRSELAACPDDDQRGYERQSLCDTGAYESDATVSARTKYDLKVTLTESADPVVINEQLTYTATVTNIGPDSAAGVTLLITLPTTGLDLDVVDFAIIDDAPGTCNNIITNEVSCALGTLARRARVQVRVTVVPNIISTLSTSASTDSSSNDSETFTPNNAVTETTEVSSTGGVTFPSSGGGGAWSWTLFFVLLCRIASVTQKLPSRALMKSLAR